MNLPSPSSPACLRWSVRDRKRGFTIIELLAALVVTSMILFFVLLAVDAAQSQARQTQRQLHTDNSAQRVFEVLSRDLQNAVIPAHSEVEWFRLHWVQRAKPSEVYQARQWITFLSQPLLAPSGGVSLISYRHAFREPPFGPITTPVDGLFRAELSPHLTLRDQLRSDTSSYWRKHPRETLAPGTLLTSEVQSFHLAVHYRGSQGKSRQLPLRTRVRFRGRTVETHPTERALQGIDQITALEMHLTLKRSGPLDQRVQTYSRLLSLPWNS